MTHLGHECSSLDACLGEVCYLCSVDCAGSWTDILPRSAVFMSRKLGYDVLNEELSRYKDHTEIIHTGNVNISNSHVTLTWFSIRIVLLPQNGGKRTTTPPQR